MEAGVRLKVLKDFNIPLKDVLSLYDPKHVIDNTIETVGASKILETLQNSENLPNFSREVEQFCSKKISLKDIVKNHTTDDLRQALTDLVKTNTVDRKDVIEKCFVPLLEKPSDLRSYLKSLSLLEIGDILEERLPQEDHTQFLSKLSQICLNGSKESLTVQLCKKDLLSTEDLTTCFKGCLSAKKEEDQTEMMVEMFRFISGKLDVEKLMCLHVEFLNRISSNFSIKDK